MSLQTILEFLHTRASEIGFKAIAAIVAWIVGRWIISIAKRLFRRVLERNKTVDATLVNYLVSIASVVLTLLLLIGIFDIVGVQTASFAALIAGAGLAIGTAWGGLLTHFAAGAFLQVLRPFKVGDIVTAGGVTGQVKELGLFGTTLVTGENVQCIVGNNKIFSDTIQNYSTLEHRRVDCQIKIAHSVDAQDAIARLKRAVNSIANVKTSPEAIIEIFSFENDGKIICVRPFTHTEHYGQVFFDTNRAIAKTVAEAGYPVPEVATVQRSI